MSVVVGYICRISLWLLVNEKQHLPAKTTKQIQIKDKNILLKVKVIFDKIFSESTFLLIIIFIP
jgi:hypothetical protein